MSPQRTDFQTKVLQALGLLQVLKEAISTYTSSAPTVLALDSETKAQLHSLTSSLTTCRSCSQMLALELQSKLSTGGSSGHQENTQHAEWAVNPSRSTQLPSGLGY